jgi:serine protease Do
MSNVKRSVSIALLIVVAFAASLVLTGRMRDANDAGAQNPAPTTAGSRPAATTPPSAPGPGPLIDFTGIAERTVPAVVNISAQQVVRQDFYVYDPFAELLGRRNDRMRSRRGVENSLGSGVIVSPDGYILTNNHVVTGESSRRVTIEQLDVTVTLSDQREMRAQVVGVDPATDLALLKVDARNLPTMPWGDSSRLKVAEWVLAIGNPYQLSQTVTLGIVSAVNRTNLGVSSYEDFVQTDAAINPGNSGGALVSARGELVGINTVIFSQSGGYQGIGFAVSSNLARRIFDDLRQHGEVRRGELVGIDEIQKLTTQAAERLGVPDMRGGVIASLYRDSPAYRAGLRPGDVIVSFNGTAVSDPGHLSRLVSDAPIGSTARLGIIREGQRLELQVPVGRRQAN